MSDALHCRDVVAGYRQQPVLQGVSLTVGEGKMTALLGPNGAGKSTLLRVVTGLQPLTAGTVELFGRDVRALRPTERARLVAVVPQELSSPMAFTVAELVALGRQVARGRWARVDGEVIERALAHTDMLELRDRRFTELSGGEKQRAAIAMALAQEPQLLLLDEPTAHLDINHRLEVLQLLERLNREKGLAVLMASHDLNLAAEFFPHLVLLDHGRVAADGPATTVLNADVLGAVYHCRLSVRRDPAGVLTVSPMRLPATGGAARRVHVIAGGGSGVEVLRRLYLAGCVVTCGALNEGDTDAAAAAALGLPVALEKPFSPLGDEALRRAQALADAAEIVVVCEVPFGAGNARNLELAGRALEQGKRVLLSTRAQTERDYTPGRQASARMQALVAAGATPWQHVGELADLVTGAP
jgi:iron complex transport system ATP-binding protein